MQQQEFDQEEKQIKKKKVYTYKDFMEFESKEMYSSIGKMNISTKETAPKFSFGSSTRDQAEKIFTSKELSKTAFIGKTSNGPIYNVTDQFAYKKDPTWKIGTNPRNTLDTGAKFDYYENEDEDFDPLEADKMRREKNPSYRIGLESRFAGDSKSFTKGTPGPIYDPGMKPEYKSTEKFSFGYRRNLPGSSPVAPLISTPVNVGPGHYVGNDLPITSKIDKAPQWSIPKHPKLKQDFKPPDKNQTYYTKSLLFT